MKQFKDDKENILPQQPADYVEALKVNSLAMHLQAVLIELNDMYQDINFDFYSNPLKTSVGKTILYYNSIVSIYALPTTGYQTRKKIENTMVSLLPTIQNGINILKYNTNYFIDVAHRNIDRNETIPFSDPHALLSNNLTQLALLNKMYDNITVGNLKEPLTFDNIDSELNQLIRNDYYTQKGKVVIDKYLSTMPSSTQYMSDSNFDRIVRNKQSELGRPLTQEEKYNLRFLIEGSRPYAPNFGKIATELLRNGQVIVNEFLDNYNDYETDTNLDSAQSGPDFYNDYETDTNFDSAQSGTNFDSARSGTNYDSFSNSSYPTTSSQSSRPSGRPSTLSQSSRPSMSSQSSVSTLPSAYSSTGSEIRPYTLFDSGSEPYYGDGKPKLNKKKIHEQLKDLVRKQTKISVLNKMYKEVANNSKIPQDVKDLFESRITEIRSKNPSYKNSKKSLEYDPEKENVQRLQPELMSILNSKRVK